MHTLSKRKMIVILKKKIKKNNNKICKLYSHKMSLINLKCDIEYVLYFY